MSSDTPNDMDPMKSFRVVRSQSHTSMDRRRSLSDAFSLLSTYTQSGRESNTVMPCLIFPSFNESMIKLSFKETHTYTNFVTYKVKDSFQQGLREERMVLVFCLVSFFGSGMSLSLTYGSDKPFGSIGIRFLASPTRRNTTHRKYSKT